MDAGALCWSEGPRGPVTTVTIRAPGVPFAAPRAVWEWSTIVLIGGLAGDTYFEVAGVITVLILLGRYLEARAKRSSGAAPSRSTPSGSSWPSTCVAATSW